VGLFPVLFAVYWSSVLVWCLLAARLCDGLSERHPLVYDALGRPAPLASRGLRGDIALLRFVLGRRYRSLDDRGLTRLCGAMRGLLCVYVIFFVSVPALILR
jgi:hypothetical protein